MACSMDGFYLLYGIHVYSRDRCFLDLWILGGFSHVLESTWRLCMGSSLFIDIEFPKVLLGIPALRLN